MIRKERKIPTTWGTEVPDSTFVVQCRFIPGGRGAGAGALLHLVPDLLEERETARAYLLDYRQDLRDAIPEPDCYQIRGYAVLEGTAKFRGWLSGRRTTRSR